jgi:ABC-type multidrug transport system permease subunit
MLISSTILKNQMEKYQLSKKRSDTYKHIGKSKHYADPISAGINSGFELFFLSIAILFLCLEFLILLYSINIALKCTSPGPERIMHVTMAMLFTVPYALFSMFFSKCAATTLQSSTGYLPNF